MINTIPNTEVLTSEKKAGKGFLKKKKDGQLGSADHLQQLINKPSNNNMSVTNNIKLIKINLKGA